MTGRDSAACVLRPALARSGRRRRVLHAKAVVVDDEAVFVTSANLTEAALDRNIEIGLLVRDQTLVATMTRHFTTPIERSLLQLLPGLRPGSERIP